MLVVSFSYWKRGTKRFSFEAIRRETSEDVLKETIFVGVDRTGQGGVNQVTNDRSFQSDDADNMYVKRRV